MLQVAHPAALARARSTMQYVALVECLKLIRNLAAKVGKAVAAATTPEVVGGSKQRKRSATGRGAAKGMEELAHALGALEALLSEGAGDTSASGERRKQEFC